MGATVNLYGSPEWTNIMSKTANKTKHRQQRPTCIFHWCNMELPLNQRFTSCDESGCCFIYDVARCISQKVRREETDIGSYFLLRLGHQLVTHISLCMQNQQPYANGNIRCIYIFSFAPSVLSLCLRLSPPSVCSHCQPPISPCKVSVVRSPSLDTAVESNAVERRGGGANSLCFVCQVCRCYATHFRVKVKSQEMQRCDFIYQWDQCVCLSA